MILVVLGVFSALIFFVFYRVAVQNNSASEIDQNTAPYFQDGVVIQETNPQTAMGQEASSVQPSVTAFQLPKAGQKEDSAAKPSDSRSQTSPVQDHNSASDEELLATHFAGIDCAQLSGTFMYPNSDIVEGKREVCWNERAVYEKNVGFCQQVSEFNRNNCITEVAIAAKDKSLCVQLEPEYNTWIRTQLTAEAMTREYIYDCYRAYANNTNDSSVCDEIPYAKEEYRISCKETAAVY